MEKLELTKESDLKLYVFSVTPPGVVIAVPHTITVTMAYDLDTAIRNVMAKNRDNPVQATPAGYFPMSFFLEQIGAEKLAGVVEPIKVSPPKPKTKEQFIRGLRLVVDEYVENKWDKGAIRGALKRLENENSPSSNKEPKAG